MQHHDVGKKKVGDRKKRLTKRQRVERDSKVKVLQPFFIGALSSRMAGRIMGDVLSKENLKRTQDTMTAEYQEMLENGIRSAIQIQSAADIPKYNSKMEKNENDESLLQETFSECSADNFPEKPPETVLVEPENI